MSSASPIRIQWLHKKIIGKFYPNLKSLADRYHISPRQAQRDVTYLKEELGAPVEYSPQKKGYYYSQPYSLPPFITNENDEAFMEAGSDENVFTKGGLEGLQVQIPYTAIISIKDKLAVMEINRFITETKAPGIYECEFHNIDHFLAVLMTIPSNLRIVEPDWLRETLVKNAKRILENNRDEGDDDVFPTQSRH